MKAIAKGEGVVPNKEEVVAARVAAAIEAVNATDKNGQTALHYAALFGHEGAVRALLGAAEEAAAAAEEEEEEDAPTPACSRSRLPLPSWKTLANSRKACLRAVATTREILSPRRRGGFSSRRSGPSGSELMSQAGSSSQGLLSSRAGSAAAAGAVAAFNARDKTGQTPLHGRAVQVDPRLTVG